MGLSTDVYENAGSVQACVNITHGFLERSSAYVRYSTYSGSAVGTLDPIRCSKFLLIQGITSIYIPCIDLLLEQ